MLIGHVRVSIDDRLSRLQRDVITFMGQGSARWPIATPSGRKASRRFSSTAARSRAQAITTYESPGTTKLYAASADQARRKGKAGYTMPVGSQFGP